MVKKYERNKNAKMVGGNALAVINNINASEMRDVVDRVFSSHNIKNIRPDGWYPVDPFMELYEKLEELPNVSQNFVAIGMAVMDTADFPTNVRSVREAIEAIQGFSEASLQGVDTSNYYKVQQVGQNHLRVEENTPYPHDLLYGFIYAIVRRFRPDGAEFSVARTYMNERNPNAAGAYYDVKWG